MGQPDLCPFAPSPVAIKKPEFVHAVIKRAAAPAFSALPSFSLVPQKVGCARLDEFHEPRSLGDSIRRTPRFLRVFLARIDDKISGLEDVTPDEYRIEELASIGEVDSPLDSLSS